MSYASRQTSYLLGSAGSTLQVLAGWWWDVYSHPLFGKVDPWWNPAYFTLYTGVGIVIFAVWRGLSVRRGQTDLINPVRFTNVSGLKLAGVGSAMQITAGVWNEIVHLLFLTEPRIAPAHVLLTVGMLTVNLGMIVGLAIEYGMIRREIIVVPKWKLLVTLGCVILVFASIWLTAALALIYVAGVFRGSSLTWIIAVLLSTAGTLVLVPAKRVLPSLGSAILIGFVFNAVGYFFLVVYSGVPAFLPLGLIPVALFDFAASSLRCVLKFTHAVLVSSSIIGLLSYATYYPFTFYLFPWSISLQLSAGAMFIGSIAGALLGHRVYDGLSSIVLGSGVP